VTSWRSVSDGALKEADWVEFRLVGGAVAPPGSAETAVWTAVAKTAAGGVGVALAAGVAALEGAGVAAKVGGALGAIVAVLAAAWV